MAVLLAMPVSTLVAGKSLSNDMLLSSQPKFQKQQNMRYPLGEQKQVGTYGVAERESSDGYCADGESAFSSGDCIETTEGCGFPELWSSSIGDIIIGDSSKVHLSS
jgi:hypothetical protein